MTTTSQYRSRKFIIAILAMLLGVLMRFRGVLSDESTLTLMITAVLGYTGGNVGQKALAKPPAEAAP